jgi:hypothetical protein
MIVMAKIYPQILQIDTEAKVDKQAAEAPLGAASMSDSAGKPEARY